MKSMFCAASALDFVFILSYFIIPPWRSTSTGSMGIAVVVVIVAVSAFL